MRNRTRPDITRPIAVILISALAVTSLAVVGPAPLASAAPAFVPPISPSVSTIVDHFRPPPTPYAAGNRGLDYSTVPGSPVVASAAGRVVFAGPVAGALHVTVLHPDGLRTTYSFLARILVLTGQEVAQGQPVGLTGSFFHFGVRDASGDYLDPEALFAGRLGAHLVAGADEVGEAPMPTQTAGAATAPERAALAAVVAEASERRGPIEGRSRPSDPVAPSARLQGEALGLWHLAGALAVLAALVTCPARPAVANLNRLAWMGVGP